MATTKITKTTATNVGKDATDEIKDGKGAKIVPKNNARKRVPLGTRNVLTARNRKGYKRRIVNVVGDRVQRFIDAGWNVVDGESVNESVVGVPSQMSSVSTGHGGNGVQTVLMEIPDEFYEEDQRQKQAKIAEEEQQLKRAGGKDDANGLSGKVDIN